MTNICRSSDNDSSEVTQTTTRHLASASNPSPANVPHETAANASINLATKIAASVGLSMGNDVVAIERHARVDHRSFTAATFGTVAFKMMEWLTPRSLHAMSREISQLRASDATAAACSQVKSGDLRTKNTDSSARDMKGQRKATPHRIGHIQPEKSEDRVTSLSDTSCEFQGTMSSSRNGRGKISAPYINTPLYNGRANVVNGALSGLNGDLSETKSPSRSDNGLGGRTSQKEGWQYEATSPGFLNRGLVSTYLSDARQSNVRASSPTSYDSSTTAFHKTDTMGPVLEYNTLSVSNPLPASDGYGSACNAEAHLPQTLSQLNVELIDFLCDEIERDTVPSTESHLHSQYRTPHRLMPQKVTKKLRRTKPAEAPSKHGEWKAFGEQTLFSVLGSPASLLSSFTTEGQLHDSQTVLYCMSRLLLVMPQLVLHSLWIAAGSLFNPPTSLDKIRLRTDFFTPGCQSTSLSSSEAGCLVSICLHALVAMVPRGNGSELLHGISRIRAKGLVVPRAETMSAVSTSLYLEYEDVFTDENALRLARRLCCAIVAQDCFAELEEGQTQIGSRENRSSLFLPLLTQLQFINPEQNNILEFSEDERLLHEVRVPTILLDWAKTILIQDWDGQPTVPSKGAFYGALLLMKTMCRHCPL